MVTFGDGSQQEGGCKGQNEVARARTKILSLSLQVTGRELNSRWRIHSVEEVTPRIRAGQ